MPYLLDSDCLITAQKHYAIDICPGFWDWLDKQNDLGEIFSIQRVASEVTLRNDDVAAWVRRKGDAFFLPPDRETALQMGKIGEWVLNPSANFLPASAARFMSGADQILVAHALAHECIVVTNETFVQVQPPPSQQSNVKIPNVCKHFGIKTKTLVDVLRATGAKFVLP